MCILLATYWRAPPPPLRGAPFPSVLMTTRFKAACMVSLLGANLRSTIQPLCSLLRVALHFQGVFLARVRFTSPASYASVAIALSDSGCLCGTMNSVGVLPEYQPSCKLKHHRISECVVILQEGVRTAPDTCPSGTDHNQRWSPPHLRMPQVSMTRPAAL